MDIYDTKSELSMSVKQSRRLPAEEATVDVVSIPEDAPVVQVHRQSRPR